MLARNLERLLTPNDRSSSFDFSNSARCSSLSTEKHSCLVSTGPSGGSLRGMMLPSMRKSGGVPVVMCMSLAPFSIIVLRSWCSVTLNSADCVMQCLLVRHGDAHDLFGSRHPVDDFLDAARTKGAHPVFDGPHLELRRRRPLQHHLLEVVAEAHHLVKSDAPLVAAAVARAAARTLL